MSAHQFAERKRLTFEQAEGIAPLPRQLAPKEIPKELRAVLCAVVYEFICKDIVRARMYGDTSYIQDPWQTILRNMHIFRDGGMVDDFQNIPVLLIAKVRAVFEKGDYLAIFGWLQWVLRSGAPYGFGSAIQRVLEGTQAAYRVVDEDTIVPFGSDAEKVTLEQAFANLAAAEFHGSRSHLKKAAVELTAGRYADSVRESIHAVESLARVLEPSAELSRALAKLEKSAKIHGALKSGFGSIYGYTSDEKGIQHPMLDKGSPKVDESDALFMIGACASFVSYLINKARAAGLLKQAL